MSDKTVFTTVDSPLGVILLVGNGQGLTELEFQDGTKPTAINAEWERDDSHFMEEVGQIKAYFAGERQQFDLQLAPKGTAFQQEVWRALRAIPYGQTISYGELAHRIGRPKAARAVGAANGANPLALIVPCHRVIGSNGRLTGYRGGLSIKEALLAHEQQYLE